MMRLIRTIRQAAFAGTALVIFPMAATAQAAQETTTYAFPVLFGRNLALEIGLVALCILLGLLAVTVSSMRKKLRKKD